MKQIIITMLFALIATHAVGQHNMHVKTDRLFIRPTLDYSLGSDRTQDLIETFRYEGGIEAKRWWTGYYEPRRHYYNNKHSKKQQKELKAYKTKMDAYDKKWEEMTAVLPSHRIMFLVRPTFTPSYGFTYDIKDTALVYLECDQMSPSLGTTKVATISMKVDEAIYDSIQTLHMLAVYTAANMDPDWVQLDGERYHFIWRDWLGDRYAQSHDNESRTCGRLQELFCDICKAVKSLNQERLHGIMPTVHQLLAYYRTLLLPDVPIDGWYLDKRKRNRLHLSNIKP